MVVASAIMPPNQQRIDQRTNIRFMVAKGMKPIEIWRDLCTVFGDRTISQTQVRVWSRCFKGGTQADSVADLACSGQPNKRKERVEDVHRMVEADRHVTIQEISKETGIHPSSVQRILKKELKFSKLSAKFVPHQLTADQMKACKDICDQNLRIVRHQDDFLQRIITGDETWVPLLTLKPSKSHQSGGQKEVLSPGKLSSPAPRRRRC